MVNIQSAVSTAGDFAAIHREASIFNINTVIKAVPDGTAIHSKDGVSIDINTVPVYSCDGTAVHCKCAVAIGKNTILASITARDRTITGQDQCSAVNGNDSVIIARAERVAVQIQRDCFAGWNYQLSVALQSHNILRQRNLSSGSESSHQLRPCRGGCGIICRINGHIRSRHGKGSGIAAGSGVRFRGQRYRYRLFRICRRICKRFRLIFHIRGDGEDHGFARSCLRFIRSNRTACNTICHSDAVLLLCPGGDCATIRHSDLIHHIIDRDLHPFGAAERLMHSDDPHAALIGG